MPQTQPFHGRTILVTGASSGIGTALARELARRGARLALFARRADRLEALAGELRAAGAEALAVPGDVTDPASVRAAHRTVAERLGPVQAAFLNAGVGPFIPLRRLTTENVRPTFEVNLFGVVHWLEHLLPPMCEAREGLVVGVSSLAAHFGAPRSGPYSASKAAVTTLLQSVRLEARPFGVRVCTVEPGFVRSELTERNTFSMPFMLEAHDAARRICDGAARGDALVRFPWPLALGVGVLRALPNWLAERLVARATPKG